jgi:hypothetical protein
MRPVDEIGGYPERRVGFSPSFGTGEWSTTAADSGYCLDVEAAGLFGYCMLQPTGLVRDYIFSVTISGAAEATFFGVAVQTNEQLNRGLAVLCYPGCHTASGVDLAAFVPDVENASTSYVPVAEASLTEGWLGELTLRVVVRGDLVEAFVGDRACITYRLASTDAGCIGLLIQDGSARFVDVRTFVLGSGQ